MSCPYQYYIDDKQYLAKLYCKISDRYCIYSKRCDNVHRFIPMDNQEECYLYNMEKQKSIPNGSYYIKVKRLNKSKNKVYIYVDIKGTIVKILTDFDEINQDYVYIKEGDNGYNVSLTPIVEKVENVENVSLTKNSNTDIDIETNYKKTAKRRNNKTK